MFWLPIDRVPSWMVYYVLTVLFRSASHCLVKLYIIFLVRCSMMVCSCIPYYVNISMHMLSNEMWVVRLLKLKNELAHREKRKIVERIKEKQENVSEDITHTNPHTHPHTKCTIALKSAYVGIINSCDASINSKQTLNINEKSIR